MLETATHVFSCKDCKIFKNTYFEEHLRTAASVTKPSLYWFLALYLFKLKKHSHFLIFTTSHANSATKVKEHGDISYSSNVFTI